MIPGIIAAGGIAGGGPPPSPITIDAESGTTAGWTTLVNSGFGVTAGNLSGSGNFYYTLGLTLGLGTNLPVRVRYTTFDIDTYYHSLVDAGQARMTCSYWCRGQSGFNDRGHFRVEFFSGAGGGGVYLGHRSTLVRQPVAATQYTEVWRVPKGARSFNLFCDGVRDGSAGVLDFHFDNITIALDAFGNGYEALYTDKGTDNAGWTIDAGSGQPPLTSGWSPYGDGGLYGGSQALLQVHKDFVPSAPALAQIAAGNATANLNRYAWNENGSDASRTILRCLGAADANLANVQDAASPQIWGWSSSTTGFDYDPYQGSIAVPTGTVKFRLYHIFQRGDGTVLDAQVAFVGAWLTW